MAAKPFPRTSAPPKKVNLALQGGGAHGAFAWGILDRFMETRLIEIEGISGTSAGSMNAVVYAWGVFNGGPEGAREALHRYWSAISRISNGGVTQFWESFFFGGKGPTLSPAAHGPALEAIRMIGNTLSPYQTNPFNYHPLRGVLNDLVDFDSLRTCQSTKLYLSATNVKTGKVRVFDTAEVSVDVVLASACLPEIFQAVEINGEHYWDGGYMGNPVLFPLFYETKSRDVIILHINPITRDEVPVLANEISDRVNEITFNASLLKELRAVAFVQKLLADGMIKDKFRDQFKDVLIHSVRADKALKNMSVATKFCLDWGFLTELRDRGRAAADEWLAANYANLGVRSSVDVRAEYL
ncbi:MAG: patatin-like phospholipase family protein [Betaproteobacteria bacterium]|nr:patatin-like phospholipase family protein [Betaproteobacteria bacterium]